jgi:glycosyltransferase involved in cell wall biosynthesis
MHVGFFSPAPPESGATNGIVTYVRVMRQALRAAGHSVTVVTPNVIERSDGYVDTLPPVGGKLRALLERRRGPAAWKRLAVLNAFRAAREAGVEIFEIEESYGWASLLKGVPIIQRAHGPHVLQKEWISDFDPRRAAAELLSFTKVDAVTFTTQSILDELRGLTSWRLARVIPNPIGLPAQRWESGSADPNQILFVGRIDSLKGADVAIDAFSKALKRRPSLRLIMVGPGQPIAAPPEVRFLGPLRPDEITHLRLTSALALGTSRRETFSYSLIEAMALGMPVVSTDWAGAHEVIPSDSEGRVVNVSALPTAILDTLGDASIGARARDGVKRRLDPHLIAEHTMSVYANALARAEKP